LLGLGLLAAAVLAPARAMARDADPALWVVRDANTTLYLFGTAHLLPKDLAWFDEAVATAFQASDELTLELLPIDDPAAVAPLVLRFAVDPAGRTMAQRLSPGEHAAYGQALERLGLPAAALEPMEPWFIAMTLSALQYVKAGLDPQSGAESVLARAARQAGKRITAFETPEQQFAILDATPEAEQLTGLRQIIQRPDAMQQFTTRIVAAWAAGDADETGRLRNEAMKDTPVSARLLLRDRNGRWAQQLLQRMARPGVVFVAVGAGHLTGPDSVQEILRKAGLTVERIRY